MADTAAAGAGADSGSPSPGKKGKSAPPPPRPMSEDLLKDSCEDGDTETMTEFELIFTPLAEIAALDCCPNLRSLTLIDSSLTRISGLEPVSRSLLRLCLTEQRISKIENLHLPNLRDLLLMDNEITAIEGLSSCPKLQRLWLYSNRITRIEGLEALGDLRELWLQNNKIATIPSMDYLVNLQVLALGNNRIADFKDLPKLASLPMLRSLSFDDVHFGTCPVVNADGYRDYVLCTLRQVQELDGEEVGAHDRKAAQDAFMASALEFSKEIENLCHKNEQELLAIEARRQRNWLNAGAMRGELLAAFGELESVVRAGRDGVVAEQQRQQRVREANLDALAVTLEEARREQSQWVERRLVQERKAMAAEEAAFGALISRAEAEAEEASFLASLAYRTRGAVVCQELSEHSPDFRFVSAHFRESMQPVPVRVKGSAEEKVRPPLRLLKAFKVFNRDAERAFVSAGDSPETLRLFSSGTRPFLRSVVEEGFGGAGAAGAGGGGSGGGGGGGGGGGTSLSGSPITVFVDPWHACAVAKDVGADVATHGGTIHALALCRVCPGRTMPLPGSSASLPNDAASRDIVVRLPKGYSAARVAASGGGIDGEEEAATGAAQCYVLPAEERARLLPEFYMLCVEAGDGLGKGGADATESALETGLAELTQMPAAGAAGPDAAASLFGGVDAEGAELLAAFQRRVTEAVARHEERVWREMDPETARKLQETEAEVKRLTGSLHTLREEIDAEKGLQEKILRDFRSQIAKGGASGKGTRSASALHRPGSASHR